MLLFRWYGLLKLRDLRKSYKLSQQKLADEIHLTQQKIHAYETGINEPDIDTLKLLANFFDTSIDYLVGNTSIRKKIEQTKPYELSEIEINFLEEFRKLQPNQRKTLLMFMDVLINKY